MNATRWVELMGWKRIALAGQEPTWAAQQAERDAGAAMLRAIGVDPATGRGVEPRQTVTGQLSAEELGALRDAGVRIALSGKWDFAVEGEAKPLRYKLVDAPVCQVSGDRVLAGEIAPVWIDPHEGDDVHITLTPELRERT